MTDLEALIASVLEAPGDSSLRLILADWLDEHNDPRGALLRLVPALLATPRQERRADVPCQWDGRRGTRGRWTPLPCPMPPFSRSPAPRYRYRGLHNLGRLLALALVCDFIEQHLTSYLTTTLDLVLASFELYQCGLLTVRQRDYSCMGGRLVDFAGALPWVLSSWAGRPFLACALWRARRGVFGGYRNAVIDLFYVLPPPESRSLPATISPLITLSYQGSIYSRALDLIDAFTRLAPWEAARRWYQQKMAISRAKWVLKR
jgi:uncharacterized protein (TIGR02996 family)